MNFLGKDEPLINLSGFDPTEEGESLQSEDFQQLHHRRQHRLSAASKVYQRELSPILKEQNLEFHESAIVSAVERTMKNYADGVLCVLEGMSGRLSQLKSISQELENSVAMLRNLVEKNHKHTYRNFRILTERTVEMHRSVQILRDKQDINEAQAQLEKLQTSRALAGKESPSGHASTESQEAMKGYQQEHTPQGQVQKPSEQLVASPSIVSQASLSPQQGKSQEPNLQSQQFVHVPHQETSGHTTQQTSNAHVTPSEQGQCKSVPQQVQVQPMLPLTPTPPGLQPRQALEQGFYLPMQRPPLQQVSSQPQLQGATVQQTEQPHYHSAPQQIEIQVSPPPISFPQSVQAQQEIVLQGAVHAQQGVVLQGPVPQQPPQLRQQPGAQLQGLYQYYGQPSDGQIHSLLAPGTPSSAQGTYSAEIPPDAANFAHQRPNPIHQSSQLPPIQSFHQMTLTPLQATTHSSRDSVSVGNFWNRQTGLGVPNTSLRLPTAQPAQPDHSYEVNRIIERVVAIGFSRDQVRSVISKLSERNQSFDTNMVVDILTNSSTAMQGNFVR